MSQIFGSIASQALFGPSHPAPSQSFMTVQGPIEGTNEDMEMFGALYGFGHTWWPSPDRTVSVRGQYYATSDEAYAAKMKALSAMGYTAPRRWQWWRWGEYRID